MGRGWSERVSVVGMVFVGWPCLGIEWIRSSHTKTKSVLIDTTQMRGG